MFYRFLYELLQIFLYRYVIYHDMHMPYLLIYYQNFLTLNKMLIILSIYDIIILYYLIGSLFVIMVNVRNGLKGINLISLKELRQGKFRICLLIGLVSCLFFLLLLVRFDLNLVIYSFLFRYQNELQLFITTWAIIMKIIAFQVFQFLIIWSFFCLFMLIIMMYQNLLSFLLGFSLGCHYFILTNHLLFSFYYSFFQFYLFIDLKNQFIILILIIVFLISFSFLLFLFFFLNNLNLMSHHLQLSSFSSSRIFLIIILVFIFS